MGKQVILKFEVNDNFQFPAEAGRKTCDLCCPMFLWDGEGHDFCAAIAKRIDEYSDDGISECPFHKSNEHQLNLEDWW